MSAPLPGDRLHALDAVRGLALLLGVGVIFPVRRYLKRQKEAQNAASRGDE